MIFIKQYLNLIIGGVILALLILIGIQQYRINSYKADIAECEKNTTILNSTIETQNASIKKQGEDMAARLQETQQALKDAEKVSKARQAKVIALNRLKTIPPKTCDEAVKSAQALL
jgi:Tfp pilus assembly protein PilN